MLSFSGVVAINIKCKLKGLDSLIRKALSTDVMRKRLS
jgi:hypothetical protein